MPVCLGMLEIVPRALYIQHFMTEPHPQPSDVLLYKRRGRNRNKRKEKAGLCKKVHQCSCFGKDWTHRVGVWEPATPLIFSGMFSPTIENNNNKIKDTPLIILETKNRCRK